MTEAEVKKVLDETRSLMQKALEHFEYELSKIRAGKANPSMLEDVEVEAYGSRSPLVQLANISTPDAKTITIQPWDASLLQAIERGIMMANIGLTPQNDGKIIRLNIPPLTEERRKDLVKQARQEAETARVSVRNIRRDANEKIKKLIKDGLPEDSGKKAEADIQNITNDYTRKIEKHLEIKEKEIMTV
ncbi:MAG: ribosome recycling factor [Chitinophagales bacterium]|nr:ribosome recycling factor [Chitinophagales bacterium]MDW8273089.1 ribosome recycling factor [Chitinophagales bacterium]